MSMSQPARILNTRENPRSSLGDQMVIRRERRTIPCISAGYLLFDRDYEAPILALTSGDTERDDAVYRDPSLHDNSLLGTVVFRYNGTVFIELFGSVRETVFNLLKSENGQVCTPTIFNGPTHSLLGQAALCHDTRCGQPRQVRIMGLHVMGSVESAAHLYFDNRHAVSIGSLVTKTQGIVGGARQLQALGPVCCYLQVGSRQCAVVSSIALAVQRLQAEDGRFRGRDPAFLPPILHPESGNLSRVAQQEMLEEYAAGDLESDSETSLLSEAAGCEDMANIKNKDSGCPTSV